jgi:hypothetical protein
MEVPAPGEESIFNVPPIWFARFLMLFSPFPAVSFELPNPDPLSLGCILSVFTLSATFSNISGQ